MPDSYRDIWAKLSQMRQAYHSTSVAIDNVGWWLFPCRISLWLFSSKLLAKDIHNLGHYIVKCIFQNIRWRRRWTNISVQRNLGYFLPKRCWWLFDYWAIQEYFSSRRNLQANQIVHLVLARSILHQRQNSLMNGLELMNKDHLCNSLVLFTLLCNILLLKYFWQHSQ